VGHHNFQHTAYCILHTTTTTTGWLLSTYNCCGQRDLTLAVNVRSRLTVAVSCLEIWTVSLPLRYWTLFHMANPSAAYVSGGVPYHSLSGAACTGSGLLWSPQSPAYCTVGLVALDIQLLWAGCTQHLLSVFDHDLLLLCPVRNLDCFFAFEVLDTVPYAQP
jgi:hypothetical protein